MNHDTEAKAIQEELCRVFESETFGDTTITQNAEMRTRLAEIVELIQTEAFAEAFLQTRRIMLKVLSMYIRPRMTAEKADFFDMIQYLYANGEDEFAKWIIFLNSNYHMTLQDADEYDKPLTKDDTAYMLEEVCSLYDEMTEKFGPDEPKQKNKEHNTERNEKL